MSIFETSITNSVKVDGFHKLLSLFSTPQVTLALAMFPLY